MRREAIPGNASQLLQEVWSQLRGHAGAEEEQFVYTDFANPSMWLREADTMLYLSVTKWVQ